MWIKKINIKFIFKQKKYEEALSTTLLKTHIGLCCLSVAYVLTSDNFSFPNQLILAVDIGLCLPQVHRDPLTPLTNLVLFKACH